MNKTHWDESGLFQAILDKCPVGIAVIDYDGHYLTVNPAYCDIYGYTQQEMLHHSFTMNFFQPQINRLFCNVIINLSKKAPALAESGLSCIMMVRK